MNETETQSEVIELSLTKTIETKLVQANVTKQVLDKLKEKYSGLKLKSVTDKEGYLEVKEAAKVCAKVRTLTTKVCKEGREDLIKQQKLWIAKEKEILAEIATVESPLDAEIDKFDKEVERVREEEKQRQEEAYINRQATLTKMGATYQDGSFVLGEASFEAQLIKGSSEDIWQGSVIPKFQAEFEKIESVKIEQKRLQDEADTERKRQQEELAAQQRKLQEEQAAFKRQQEESERMLREKEQSEEREKQRLQTELQNNRLQKILPFNPYSKALTVNPNALWSISESDFDELFTVVKTLHENEQLEKQAAIEAQAAQKERERIAEEQRQAEIKKQQEEARKAEELAQAKDKDKWDEFIRQLSGVTTFEMRSGQYRKKMLTAKEKIEEIQSL